GSAKIWGGVLGVRALGGAGFAGWTLYSVSKPAAMEAEQEPGEHGVASMQTVEAVLASVQQLVKDENWSAAEKVLAESVRTFPDDQDLRLAFGDFLMTRERWDEAYDQYAAGIAAGPVPAQTYFAAGTLANMSRRAELAAEHYRQAAAADPTNAEYPLYLASMQMKLSDWSAAKASLALAGRLAPDRAEVWGMYAQVALHENRLSIAQLQVEKARRLEPRESAWVLMEAKIRKRAGEPEGALDLLSALPQSELDRLDTLELLAECYGMLGRPGDAASRYMDAAERNPRNASLVFETALWLERAGERGEAIAWAERARGLGHDQAGAWIAAQADD
ncbi:MAG: tetratricopeptide repeat protein, partial [Planctomycetota bacterium]